MSNVAGDAAETAVGRLLARVRDWWRQREEFGNLTSGAVEHIAADFGMTGKELRDLAAKGPQAADLLYRRMAALGLSRSDVERVANGLMRDLEKTCSCCSDKTLCKADLAAHPDDPGWKHYCPNAISLEALKNAKGRCPL